LSSFLDYNENYALYTNKICNYRIIIPSEWSMRVDSASIVLFELRGIPESKESISLVEVPNVVLDTYVEEGILELPRRLTDFKLRKNERVVINGFKAREIAYSALIGNLRVEVVSCYLQRPGNLIAITCLGLKDSFSEYAAKFRNVTRSFESM
jgi:hypothetical protein